MNGRPFFSIVLATRNRAGFLPFALRSALDQRHADYEIVVSDNCSTDGTEHVARRLADDRVRYVRTPRPLSLPAHHQFALAQAQGEYITSLNDDDALAPGALERAAKIIAEQDAELLVWKYCQYHYETSRDRRLRRRLVVRPFTGDARRRDARDGLAAFYSLAGWELTPVLTNTVYAARLLERVRRRTSRPFPLLTVDIFLGVQALVEARAFWELDVPFSVYGLGRHNNAFALLTRGDSGRASFEQFPEEAAFECAPFRSLALPNLIVEALLRAKQVVGQELAELGIDLDWAAYFRAYHDALRQQQEAGVDVRADLEAFQETLRLQPEDVRRRVQAQLQVTGTPRWRRGIRKIIDRFETLRRLEDRVRVARDERPLVLECESILEAARAVDRLVAQGWSEGVRTLG